MPNNRHVFLINESAVNPKFKRSRNIQPTGDQQEKETLQPKLIRKSQKVKLRMLRDKFNSQQVQRNENRTILFPKVIDLIRISFFCVFNQDLIAKFYSRYGLNVIEFSNFNKTVMFEVNDRVLFRNFQLHINSVIKSPENTPYENQPFNLIALIYQFEFISSQNRMDVAQEGTFLITLISSTNQISTVQKEALFNFFEDQKLTVNFTPFSPDIIEVEKVSKLQTKLIIDNFDIIKAVLSTRVSKIRPGVYGTVRREFGFTVDVPKNLTTVCIIDSGVNRIDPLRDVITEISYNHTSVFEYWDEEGHGTLVSGLVVLGDEFQSEIKTSYTAKAKIAIIKVLHHGDDCINIPQLLTDIRDARRKHGIRLFNMSLVIPPSKKYNEIYSQFAYELDKLAFEEDVLIFISVGNVDADYIQEMIQDENHPDHEYPAFFYKPDTTSVFHRCENTNISVPSESLNNISVGALAGNLEEGDNSDLTPNAIYPAYYTRKFHIDYNLDVITEPLRPRQRNKFLNKPDLVFEGETC